MKKEVFVLYIKNSCNTPDARTDYKIQERLSKLETELAVTKAYLEVCVTILSGIIAGLVGSLLRAFLIRIPPTKSTC